MVACSPQALNRLIWPVLPRGTVVSSPPCWPMIRTVVPSSSTVTILPMFLGTTWTTAGVGDVDDRDDNPDQRDKEHLGGTDRSGG